MATSRVGANPKPKPYTAVAPLPVYTYPGAFADLAKDAPKTINLDRRLRLPSQAPTCSRRSAATARPPSSGGPFGAASSSSAAAGGSSERSRCARESTLRGGGSR